MLNSIDRKYSEEQFQNVHTNGFVDNGEFNSYPNIIENCVNISPTASQCVGLLKNHIQGGGFLENGDLMVNQHQNLNDLLESLSDSVSLHNGAFIHVSYNVNLEISSLKVLNYSDCRISKPDSQKFSGKILYNAATKIKRSYNEYDKGNVFYSYNRDLLEKQFDSDGGKVSSFRGQVYYLKINEKGIYTKSVLHPVIEYCILEDKIKQYYLSNIEDSFSGITLVQHAPFSSKEQTEQFRDQIKKQTGTNSKSRFLFLEEAVGKAGNKVLDTKKVSIDSIEDSMNIDNFAHLEQVSSDSIRKSCLNIPPQLINYVAGKLGNTTGEDLKVAQSIYNTRTAPIRKKIAKVLTELLNKSVYKIEKPLEIVQYKITGEDGTSN